MKCLPLSGRGAGGFVGGVRGHIACVSLLPGDQLRHTRNTSAIFLTAALVVFFFFEKEKLGKKYGPESGPNRERLRRKRG